MKNLDKNFHFLLLVILSVAVIGGCQNPYDADIDGLTEAIRANPNSDTLYQWRALHYKNKADAYGDKGDYNRAIADCTMAIRLAPNDGARISYYQYRSRLYKAKGDDANASADNRTATQLLRYGSQ